MAFDHNVLICFAGLDQTLIRVYFQTACERLVMLMALLITDLGVVELLNILA